jgi:thioredoxin 1
MVTTLKFYATWCGPCSVVSKQLEGLNLQEVDLDQDEEGLAVKYKIRNVPTLVFLKDGVEVDRHSGLITRDGYLQKVNDLENGG